jgi:hypothetical protein
MSDLGLQPKEYGASPIGCRPKGGQVAHKTKASASFLFPALALFLYMPLD